MTYEEELRAHALAAALRQQGAQVALNHVAQVGQAATLQQVAEIEVYAQQARQAELDRAAANRRRLAATKPRHQIARFTEQDVEDSLKLLYGGTTAGCMAWALEHDPRLAHALADAALAPLAQQAVGRLRGELAQREAEARQLVRLSRLGHDVSWTKA